MTDRQTHRHTDPQTHRRKGKTICLPTLTGGRHNYQLSEQQSLRNKLYNTENPREFWTEIGKIGMANDRKSRIPFEVSDQDGIKTDPDSVLGKWKSDYEHLYNKWPNRCI